MITLPGVDGNTLEVFTLLKWPSLPPRPRVAFYIIGPDTPTDQTFRSGIHIADRDAVVNMVEALTQWLQDTANPPTTG